MTFLPDVNVWLALAFESHFHHASAKAWFNCLASGSECAFCRTTQQGFLRLATNPKAFGDETVTLAEAWRIYDAFLSDPCVSFAVEAPGIDTYWRDFTMRRTFSPKVWNDAFLAAFARAAGIELVTFDLAFGQYPGTGCTILHRAE